MPTGDGKTIPPTGKSFQLTMVTIGHWNGATMDHERLFWDNHGRWVVIVAGQGMTGRLLDQPSERVVRRMTLRRVGPPP